MAELTEFCTITATLNFSPVGKVLSGMRLDARFTGTATSSHWEGERPVSGIDYVTVRSDGSMDLDVRGLIGTGADTVSYKAVGRSDADGAREAFVFETANEDLAWLNNAVGVAVGGADGADLKLTVSILSA